MDKKIFYEIEDQTELIIHFYIRILLTETYYTFQQSQIDDLI